MTQLPSDRPVLFQGRHFDHLLIIQSVRWYTTFKLSYRDVCALMAERGVTVVHTTVMRWVRALCPCLREAVEERCPTRQFILESGRDIYPREREVDLPLPCSR